MLLAEPMEFIDLADGESMMIRVDEWLDGSAVIHPNRPSQRHRRMFMDQRAMTAPPMDGEPISVEVPVLRLSGQRIDRTSIQHHFDVSSKTLRADLLARFVAGLTTPVLFRFTAVGHRPHKRYSVEVVG